MVVSMCPRYLFLMRLSVIKAYLNQSLVAGSQINLRMTILFQRNSSQEPSKKVTFKPLQFETFDHESGFNGSDSSDTELTEADMLLLKKVLLINCHYAFFQGK